MNSNESKGLRARVRGPFALFTRPEVSPERMSYDVLTPTAAVGILESILWKPGMRWTIKAIMVLKPLGSFMTIKSNEVKKGAYNDEGYVANEVRTQRTSLVLKDVDYVIEATIRLTDKAGEQDNLTKFVEMFERRLEKGQLFRTPYLGLRQFTAYVSPVNEAPAPVNESRDLGEMPLRVVFGDPPTIEFFHAKMERGVIRVPAARS